MTKLRIIAVALALASASALAGCIQQFGAKDDEVEPNGGVPDPTNGTGANPPEPTVKQLNDLPTPKIRITNDRDPKNETNRGFKGDVLVLDASGSQDPDGFITAWEWEIFEPTGSAEAPEPQKHSGERVANIVFGTEGVKVIKLTVTDNLGATASTATFYYRDVSYSYGDQFHWTGPLTSEVKEEREHTLPVYAGAAVLAAHVVVKGAKAEIALVDPNGTEHVRASTEDADNVTIVMDHSAPMEGDWTIKVTVTYAPATTECAPDPVGACHSVPVAASADANYGLDGIVWYGEKPAEISAGDGHGGHAH